MICLFLFQFDPHFSLFEELKYSDKKGFKKFCFEFSQFKLTYQKDPRVSICFAFICNKFNLFISLAYYTFVRFFLNVGLHLASDFYFGKSKKKYNIHICALNHILYQKFT